MKLFQEAFGPSQDNVWRRLSDQVGGDFIKGGLWRSSVLLVPYRQWTVVFDSYLQTNCVPYTRVRACYFNKDGFRFAIYRRGLFGELRKLLGMHAVETGHQAFDDAFIVQGNNEHKLRALLADVVIRKRFEEQQTVNLSAKDDEGWLGPSFPEGVDELCFEVCGAIKDLVRLGALYALFAEILDRLCEIGSAYEDDPGLIL